MRAAPVLVLAVAVLVAGTGACGGTRQAVDGGPAAGATREFEAPPCERLLAKVCGDPSGNPVPGCDSPQCNSARLASAHQPDLCASLIDDDRYLACGPDGGSTGSLAAPPPSCTTLVAKCCGTQQDAGCANADACLDATDVYNQRDHSTCRQALDDDTSFPRCSP